MSERVDDFVKEWVSHNVQNVPGLEYQAPEVARLSAKLTADAAAHGIKAHELEETIGDPEDYLENEYLNVHDPDAGGFR